MTFHVPNEKASARTVGVRIEVPEGVRGVRAEPVAGWVVEPAEGDADRTVGWSGGAIGGENEAEFVLHIDRLPTGVPELAFVARQEYDDGEVVTWDQETVEGQPEPDHPAPVLSLTGGNGRRGRDACRDRPGRRVEGGRRLRRAAAPGGRGGPGGTFRGTTPRRRGELRRLSARPQRPWYAAGVDLRIDDRSPAPTHYCVRHVRS